MTPSTKTNGTTPYELWFNKKPSAEHTKVFGCKAFVHIPVRYRDKLDPRSRLCMYVGIPSHKKGYRLLDPETLGIVYSRDVVFKEDEFPSLNLQSTLPIPSASQSTSEQTNQTNQTPFTPLPYTTSDANPGDGVRIYSFTSNVVNTNMKRKHCESETSEISHETTDTNLSDLKSPEEIQDESAQRDLYNCLLASRYIEEPTSFYETMQSSHSQQWREAATSEIQSHQDNEPGN